MLIPKQAIPGTPAPKGGNPVEKGFGIMSDIAKAADKLPARKVKIKTVYGTYEVEHKGELRKRTVDNYRETIEAEGAKQGWARVDGTVADDGAKAVENIKKATPAQYEQAKKAVAKPAPKAKASEPQPRVNSSAQSKITAYDQSRVEQDPTQEYTGGDARLARNGQGKGKTSTELRRMAPQEEGVNVNDKTKQILQGIETVVGTVLDKTGLYRKANDLVEGVAKSNDQAATYDPLLGMLTGVATDTLHPVSSFASATGNLYDPTATAEERLGAAGNVALYGLGAAGNLTAARGAAESFAKFSARRMNALENSRVAKNATTSGLNDLAPKSEPSSFEGFRNQAQGGTSTPDTIPISQAFENYPPTKPTTETPGVTTSARKAQVAEDRANMGLDPLDDPVRKTFGQSLDNARAKGYDEGWANREAEAVVAKPRALNDEETAGMVDVLAKLKNDHKALLKDAEMATDPADLTRINDQLMGVEKQFDNISTAVRKSGTEKGRALASQKLTINEDFDLISVRSRARANKGGELTPKQDEELVKRVEDLQTEIANQGARIKELSDELVKALEVNTVKRRAGGFSRESTSAVRQQAATRFQEKVAKSSARASMLALNDATPEVIKAFREYVNAVVADGARSLDDVIKKMADDGVNADAEDIYTALTAKTGLRKLSDLQKELNDARKALRAESRDSVRPNWRQEAKDKAKATRESPEGVAKQVKRTKEQLQADIAKLDEQIKSGEYIEAQPKKVREVDAEVYKLRAIRKMKEDRIRAIQESVRPLSGAEKVGMVMTEMKMLNPFARMTDVAANTTNLASTAVETPARILVDKLVGAVTKQDPLMKWNFETRDRLGRVMDRIKNSTGAEFQRTWTGTDKASMEKFGKSRGPGGKLAGSTDVPFRVVYREFAMDLFADLKARRTLGAKASKADIADMRESFLRRIDEHPDIIDAAEEYSLHKTFNNDNLVSKSFGQIRNQVIKNELGKVAFDETIARFSKVITNVGQDAFDRTPYGLVTQGLRLAIKRGNLTDVERLIITDRLAKGMVGSAFTALGYAVGDKLSVEFKGDKNKYVDFGDAEKLGGLPGSFLLGVARRQAEKLKPDQRDLFERQQVTNLLTNSPAASNVQDMLGALMQPGANKPEQFVAKKLTNMAIPSAIRDTARRMDSPNFGLTGGATRRETISQEKNPDTGRMRQTRNFWLILMKDAQSKIPVARQALPEKGDK